MNRQDREVLEKLQKSGVNYNYFFNKISSVNWLQDLTALGYFKEPILAEKAEGYISFRKWAPAEYLIKVAAQDPRSVMDVILAAKETDNAAVHAQFVEAAINMPAVESKRLVNKITTWLKQPNLHNLSHVVPKLVRHLAENGELESAIKLSKHMLVLNTPTDPREVLMRHPIARIGTYELEEFIKNEVSLIFKIDPSAATALVVNVLRTGLNIEGREKEKDGLIQDLSEIWMPDIEKESHRSSPNVALAYQLLKMAKLGTDPKIIKLVVGILTKEKHLIFHRIAALLIGSENEDPDLSKLYDNIVKQIGEPTHDPGITSWTGPESPLKDEDIGLMSTDELIRYLGSWKPSGKLMSPSREGLGYQINRKVAENPQYGISLLKSNEDISHFYLDDIFSGLDTVVRNKQSIDWTVVFDSLVKILDKINEPVEKQDYNLVLTILRLIREGCDQDQIDLGSKELRRLIMRYIGRGLSCDDPDTSSLEDPFDKSRDPNIGAINCVRGVSLFTLSSFLKRATRQGNDKDSPLKMLTETEVEETKKILSTYASLINEKSFAVRTFYAHDLPYLWYALGDWAPKHLDDIFPQGQDDYFKVEVESLAEYAQVYFPYFENIKPILSKYIERVKDGSYTDIDAQTRDHFASKIIIYYLNGLIELDDGLLIGLLSLPVEWAVTAMDFIGRNLKELDPVKDKALLTKIAQYWDNRSKDASKEELASFSMWMASDNLDLEWRKAQFLNALKQTNSVGDLWIVFDWLLENAERHPLDVAKIFNEIIRTQNDQEMRFTINQQIEELLESLAKSGDESINALIRDIVDRLLKKGHGDFRKLLKS